MERRGRSGDEEAGFMLYAILKQAYRPESGFTLNRFT